MWLSIYSYETWKNELVWVGSDKFIFFTKLHNRKTWINLLDTVDFHLKNDYNVINHTVYYLIESSLVSCLSYYGTENSDTVFVLWSSYCFDLFIQKHHCIKGWRYSATLWTDRQNERLIWYLSSGNDFCFWQSVISIRYLQTSQCWGSPYGRGGFKRIASLAEDVDM